jgi:multidrug resistance efflux pump
MNKKRIFIGGGIVGIVAIVCALAMTRTRAVAGAQGAATGTLLPPVASAGGIIADAKVVPSSGAELAFPTGGVVASVAVREGQAVRAGDVLARLAGYEQAESEVASAQQELLAARQALEEVKRNGLMLAAQAGLDEQTARENKAVAESNGWDTSTHDITRAKYALLVAKWQAAEKKLEQYPNGVPEEELSLAQARVESAEKRLAAAEAGVKNLELRSPLDGTVVFLDLTAGQVAAPGVVVVAVADLSVWQVRTTDLSEMDIPRVAVGDKAVVTLDALPGLQLTGKVVSVSAYGQNRQGETVYTVTVQIDKADDRLRWNMTAMVKID